MPEQYANRSTEAAGLNGNFNEGSSAFSFGGADPFTLNNEKTEGRLIELGRRRLDPALASQRAGLETSLANKGITMGSQAWNAAMGDAGQRENDAYTSLLLGGREQATNEQLSERGQQWSEATGARDINFKEGLATRQQRQNELAFGDARGLQEHQQRIQDLAVCVGA
jgi:hypothetical protein